MLIFDWKTYLKILFFQSFSFLPWWKISTCQKRLKIVDVHKNNLKSIGLQTYTVYEVYWLATIIAHWYKVVREKKNEIDFFLRFYSPVTCLLMTIDLRWIWSNVQYCIINVIESACQLYREKKQDDMASYCIILSRQLSLFFTFMNVY
jgi:hypothetical protein